MEYLFDEEPIRTVSIDITEKQARHLGEYIQSIVAFVGAKRLIYTVLPAGLSAKCPLTLHVSKYPVNMETLIKTYYARDLLEFKRLILKKYNKL